MLLVQRSSFVVRRSSLVVHRSSLGGHEPLEFLEPGAGRLHIIELGRYAHAVPRRLPLRPVPACRRDVVADQRPPGVPTCSVRTRSRGRMHTQPYSRWRWCSATSATTKVRDLLVTCLRYSLLRSRTINQTTSEFARRSNLTSLRKLYRINDKLVRREKNFFLTLTLRPRFLSL